MADFEKSVIVRLSEIQPNLSKIKLGLRAGRLSYPFCLAPKIIFILVVCIKYIQTLKQIIMASERDLVNNEYQC